MVGGGGAGIFNPLSVTTHITLKSIDWSPENLSMGKVQTMLKGTNGWP